MTLAQRADLNALLDKLALKSVQRYDAGMQAEHERNALNEGTFAERRSDEAQVREELVAFIDRVKDGQDGSVPVKTA